MRKEIPLAIAVGSFVGVAFAGLIWKTSTSSTPAIQTETVNDDEALKNNKELFLNINTPTNLSTHSSSLISVKGSTNPNTLVAVILNDESSLSRADDAGNFNLTIDLEPGINSLSVYSSLGGESTAQNLQVVHSTKVEGDSLNSVFGTVTDITDVSIQVREENGEITQVAITENTTYANILKASKEVTFEDLAIGDYIAVLDDPAQRILVTVKSSSKSKVVAGRVDVFNDDEFVVVDSASKKTSIDAKGNVSVTQFSEDGKISIVKLSTLEEGDNIFVIGEIDDDELMAEKIHIF